MDANWGRCGGKPAINCLSYGMAKCFSFILFHSCSKCSLSLVFVQKQLAQQAKPVWRHSSKFVTPDTGGGKTDVLTLD
jgi:hypothetical protein